MWEAATSFPAASSIGAIISEVVSREHSQKILEETRAVSHFPFNPRAVCSGTETRPRGDWTWSAILTDTEIHRSRWKQSLSLSDWAQTLYNYNYLGQCVCWCLHIVDTLWELKGSQERRKKKDSMRNIMKNLTALIRNTSLHIWETQRATGS